MEIHSPKPIQVFDNRGTFFKSFYESSDFGPSTFQIREVFTTTSRIGVVRGLHFQLPPKSQSKLISILQGKVLEVYVDLRLGSQEYGLPQTCILSDPNDGANQSSLFIPSGFAHGYQAIEDNTIVQYLADQPFDAKLDAAINIKSFQIDWPIQPLILSEKDLFAPHISEFSSPYRVREDG